jgi:hypothetical protein
MVRMKKQKLLQFLLIPMAEVKLLLNRLKMAGWLLSLMTRLSLLLLPVCMLVRRFILLTVGSMAKANLVLIRL